MSFVGIAVMDTDVCACSLGAAASSAAAGGAAAAAASAASGSDGTGGGGGATPATVTYIPGWLSCLLSLQVTCHRRKGAIYAEPRGVHI